MKRKIVVAIVTLAVVLGALTQAGCAVQGSLTPVTSASTTHQNEWRPNQVRCLFGKCPAEALPGEGS